MAERLLLAAHDPVCGSLRRRILEIGGYGYEVVSTPTVADSLAALQKCTFALVLLSHTSSQDELRMMVEVAKCSRIGTVLIHATTPPDIGADFFCRVEDPLVTFVGELLGRPKVRCA